MNEGSKAVKQKNKILYIEPNDLPAFLTAKSPNGSSLDNITWNPEDLNIFVDLQVVIPSRQYNPSELKEYGDFDFNDAKYQSILSGVKLGKHDNFLTDDWTVMSYQEIKNNRAGSKEMLGINSIQISFDSHLYPRVTINFTDVRGSALMQPQEQRYLDLNGKTREGENEATKNFFANLFKFPYPRFLLSVKGVYGTCVTFVLSVEDFKATFNSETGNFDVVVKFIGNMYGLYTDIPMNYLLIAPYIFSKKGGFVKNEYWTKQTEEGAFHYNENGQKGRPISTFLEFYSQYHNNFVLGNTDIAYGDNIQQMSSLSRESSMLTEILSKFYDEIELQADVLTDGVSKKSFINDSHLSKNVIFYDNEVHTVSFSDSFVNDSGRGFRAAVEAYEKEFPNGFFNSGKSYFNVSDMYRNGKTSFQTFKVDLTAKQICGELTEKDSSFIKAFKDEDKAGFKYAFVYSKSFKEDVERYIAKINEDFNDRMSGATKEIEPHFKELFGFTPTVENIMRMLFAHLDCFLNLFYSNIMEIKGTRTLKSLGGFPKFLTDIESSSGDDAHVPPYTAFFRENGEKKMERVFPGEYEDGKFKALSELKEVKFVEGILNGIGSMKDWQEEYLGAGEDSEDISEGEEAFNMEFVPTLLSDIYYEGKNPYSALRGELYAHDLVYFFLCRLYQHYIVHGSGSEKEFAEIEAQNFINSSSFKEFLRKNDFKDSINKYAGSNGTFGNTFYHNLFGAGWPFSFSKNKFPIYTIARDGIKYSIEPDNSMEPKFPMKYEGLNAFNNSFVRSEKSGFLIGEYSEPAIKSFSEKVKAPNNPCFLNFNYEFKPFVGGGVNDTTVDGTSPIVPLSYVAKEGGGYFYYPVYKTKGDTIEVEGDWNDFTYYVRNTVYVKDEEGKPKKSHYATYNGLLEEADIESLWIPAVRWKNTTGNTKHNLLINFTGNPIISQTTGNGALLFLFSLFFGFKWEKGDKKLSKNIEKFFNGTDLCEKISKSEYLLICGIAYASTHNEIVLPQIANSKEAIAKALSEEERNRMGAYFKEWADGDFKTKISDVVKSYDASNNWGALIKSGNKKVKTRKGEFDVALYGTPLQRYLIELYKETVIPFMINLPSDKRKKMPVEQGGAVGIFARKIKETLDKINTDETTGAYQASEVSKTLEFNDNTKNVIYYTLKNLYDRWLSMQSKEDFRLYSVEEETEYKKERLTNGGRLAKDRSEFTNFVYVDSFYNDISKKFMINPEKLFLLLGDQFDGTKSYNILEFIGKICQDNKLLFRCLPVYSNVYSAENFAEIFTPHSLYDGSSRTGRRIGNTYMLMYTYEPSHFLNIEQDKSDGVNYGNDSFDIADSFGNITQESLEVMKKNDNEGETNYSVCAFGVTAAKQNQSYFTKINVGMDNPRVTDFSIMNKFQLANLSQRGGTTNLIGQGQDLFSVYSNRSYDCSVEMLGCANIMPMMYFQLNNVPMFKGVYMITKVEHNISNNTMVTKFTGTRQPKNYIPLVSEVFNLESINEAINRISNTDMKARYNTGNFSVEYSPFNNGTTFLSYDGTKTKFNGQCSSFPKGDTFYPWAAVAQMKEILYYSLSSGSGYLIPKGNTSNYKKNPDPENYHVGSCGACATAVQSFLCAGFNGHKACQDKDEAVRYRRFSAITKGFTGCNGYEMYNCLVNYGFMPYMDLSNWDDSKLQAGDVCVMEHGTYGHVCMFTGKEDIGKWVSDFEQKDWWVYNSDKNKSTLKGTQAIVYRFAGKISNEKKEYEGEF